MVFTYVYLLGVYVHVYKFIQVYHVTVFNRYGPGYDMLINLGWADGTGLGKFRQGITSPVSTPYSI